MQWPEEYSSFTHIPVMLEEVLTMLAPVPGGRYADGTVGGGGHASAILQRSAPDGWLYGCDRDGAAIEAATERLKTFAGRFELRRGHFGELADWVPAGECDGILLDLGVSSPQLDRAERGFSFRSEGPLDMRMDTRQSLTAAKLINESSVEELARIFWQYGEERHARRLAREIGEARVLGRFETTVQLASFIERLSPRGDRKIHPATRVFQALRIAVNDELRVLEEGLRRIFPLLKQGGRLAVITFHSLEARVVKGFVQRLERDYAVKGEVDIPEFRRPVAPQLRRLTRKPVEPSSAETDRNPRARSAQLRVVERL